MSRSIALMLMLVVLALPVTSVAAESKTEKTNFTFVVKEVDLRDVFQVIAKKASFNLILDKSIRGKVSVHMRNIPFMTALKALAASNNLVVVPYKGLYIITPAAKSVIKNLMLMDKLSKNSLPKPLLNNKRKRFGFHKKRKMIRRKRRFNGPHKRRNFDGPPRQHHFKDAHRYHSYHRNGPRSGPAQMRDYRRAPWQNNEVLDFERDRPPMNREEFIEEEYEMQ